MCPVDVKEDGSGYKMFVDFCDDIKQRIKIDKNNLSNECVNQPIMYSEIGEMATKAKSQARRAKDFYELVVARKKTDIRANAEKYGITKVTEGAIDAITIQNGEVQGALVSLRDAEEISEALSILLGAGEQRKAMIRDLVTLYVYEYYSNTDMKGDERDSIDSTKQRITNLRKNRRGKRSDRDIL